MVKGDVIQVNEKVPEWCGCLMIIEEVYSWGVMAGLKIPMNGTAYLRLTHEQYEPIGTAVFVPKEED